MFCKIQQNYLEIFIILTYLEYGIQYQFKWINTRVFIVYFLSGTEKIKIAVQL